MKRFVIFVFILVFGVIAAFFIMQLSHISDSSSRIKVVCTTSMITDAVRQIGGDYVEVVGLMGSGVDPHLYKAKASDVAHLSHADIIFYNGLHLEGKMTDIFDEMNAYKTVVPIARNIDTNRLIHSGFINTFDPHIWHDVLLFKSAVQTIAETLMTKDLDHREQYAQSLKTYEQKLDELDEEIKQKIQTIPPSRRILVTAHDAFEYFGRAYGLQVVGLQGMSTDAEISTKDIQNLVNLVVEKQVPAIFVESSIPHRSIQAVQQAIAARGWSVKIGDELFSDALGDAQTNADTYCAMIRHNVENIVSALQ